MVNLIDVVISNSDGGDWREMGSCRGLRPEAAVYSSLWLPGEGLALLWMLQVLDASESSMKLSRPLTLFVLHTSLDRMGTGVVNSLLQMDTGQTALKTLMMWTEQGGIKRGPRGWPWFCFAVVGQRVV